MCNELKMSSNNRINTFYIYRYIELLNYEKLEEYLSNKYINNSGESYWFMLENVYENHNHLYNDCKQVAKVLQRFYQNPTTFDSKLLLKYKKDKERKKEMIRLKTVNTLALCLNRHDAGKNVNKDIFLLIKEYL